MRPLPVMVLMVYSLVSVTMVFDQMTTQQPLFRCPDGRLVGDARLCSVMFSEEPPFVGGTEIAVGEPRSPTAEERKAREQLDPRVFMELPLMPDDFWSVMDSASSELCSLGEEYWKQPEFYPTFISDSLASGLNIMLTPPQGRAGVHGYGAYPAGATINIASGREETVCTFFQASWFIETYQGLGLGIENPLPEYLDVVISPDSLLLEPTWGRFMPGWTQRIEVTVSAKMNTPKGSYVLKLNPMLPPIEDDAIWSIQHRSYVRAGGMSFDKPFFTIRVVVS